MTVAMHSSQLLNFQIYVGPILIESLEILYSPLKPGSHLCDKHNTSEISISIRRKKHVPFFLCLCSFPLCYAYRVQATRGWCFCIVWYVDFSHIVLGFFAHFQVVHIM